MVSKKDSKKVRKNTLPLEVELKLAVPPAARAALRRRLARLGVGRRGLVDSRYFDTADFALAQQRAALRVRKIGGRWVQTLKTGDALAALSARGESEVPAPRGRLALDRFDAALIDRLLPPAQRAGLAPRFRTRFERTTWLVQEGDALIEVAFDEGSIELEVGTAAEGGTAAERDGAAGGSAVLPILELELELKRGEPGALFALAQRLQGGPARGGLPLLPLGSSKAARGVLLARGEAVQPARAAARGFVAHLTPHTRATVALRQVFAHGTEVLLANAHGALQSDAPEFVHQGRVALRRMRSAARLLRNDSEVPDHLLAGMRWIAAEIGAARDWDVAADQTLPLWLEQLGPARRAAAQPLAHTAQLRHGAARAQARAALAGSRMAALALALLAWSAQPPAERSPRLQQLAPRAIRRAQSRLLAQAQLFSALSAARRHRVRILAKRLRYALELLAVVLPRKSWRASVVALEQAQLALGEMNDAAVAARLLVPLATAAPAAADLRTWLAQREAACTAQAAAALDQLTQIALPID